MILFTNLENVRIGKIKYNPVSILKLTTGSRFNMESLKELQKKMLGTLKEEAKTNKFRITINNEFFV